jgi:transglutaminase-like putative cysteine protease
MQVPLEIKMNYQQRGQTDEMPQVSMPHHHSATTMQIHVGFEMEYQCPGPTPMILALNIHYSRASDLVRPDHLLTSPAVQVSAYRDLFGNWCSRIVAPQGRFVLSTDALFNDSGLADVVAPWAVQTPVEQLPESVLVYLLGSRYCDTDQLSEIAWQQFGAGPSGWGRVQAICDFVHQHIEFGYQHARRTRTAWEAYREGRGVCRDYAHLAITFCRCMNIPARYCTGYLGDIGIPFVPGPMDFTGWFEAYLGDRWYTFDARNNTPRIGRILMARGRDACDVALASTFGPNTLVRFRVWADEVIVF